MSSDEASYDLQARDQLISDFARILKRLVETTPGAIGAALADEEGETVDYFGDTDPDELRLAAAYMGIMLNRSATKKAQRLGGPIREIRIQSELFQFVCRPLGLGYQVTVVLERIATLPKLDEALEQAIAELRIEAGGVLD
jgi:predicted regulator of Ras-like GTPase activity (Roadblock/LC7/MglB family)